MKQRWENYIILNDQIRDPKFLSRLKNSGAECNKCNLAEVSINLVHNFKKSVAQVQDIQEYFRSVGNLNLTLHPQYARRAEKAYMLLDYISRSRSSIALCNFKHSWNILGDLLEWGTDKLKCRWRRRRNSFWTCYFLDSGSIYHGRMKAHAETIVAFIWKANMWKRINPFLPWQLRAEFMNEINQRQCLAHYKGLILIKSRLLLD